MMGIQTGATDVIGGTGLGGFGGGGILEGLILGALLRNGNGGLFGGNGSNGDMDADAIAAKVVELQNTSDLRSQIVGVQSDLQAALQAQDLNILTQLTATNAQIAQVDKNATIAALESKLASVQSQNAIQGSIDALSVKSDAQNTQVLMAINADGDKTRALITANEIANLREALELERRGRESREIEINIANSNAQSQAQLQQQTATFAGIISPLVDQLAKQNQGIVAIGSTLTGNAQTASNANTKVS
jgi:hypothetical protein